MVTETLGYLPRHKVVIMDIPEVMSEAHYGHLSEVMKMGGVQILGSSGGGVGVVHSEAESSEAKSIAGPSEETAAIQIARVFWRSNTKSLTAEASALALA
jgi:hypothetical protein